MHVLFELFLFLFCLNFCISFETENQLYLYVSGCLAAWLAGLRRLVFCFFFCGGRGGCWDGRGERKKGQGEDEIAYNLLLINVSIIVFYQRLIDC